jgi:DNA-binding MarR family transcriptional regulator
LDNKCNHDDYIFSDSITEKGIQSLMNCSLSYISQILKKIEEEGYVYRKLVRIENKKRKQKAVFLTDEGLELAERIKQKNLEEIEKRK